MTDAAADFVFHFLQGFWYRLVVDATIFERRLDRASPRVLQPEAEAEDVPKDLPKNVPASDSP